MEIRGKQKLREGTCERRNGKGRVIEIIVEPDIEDVATMMKNGGEARMGFGEASGENKCIEAVGAACDSPLLDFPIWDADGAIVYFVGDCTVSEVSEAVNHLHELMGGKEREVNILFGCAYDEKMKDAISVTLMVFIEAPVATDSCKIFA